MGLRAGLGALEMRKFFCSSRQSTHDSTLFRILKNSIYCPRFGTSTALKTRLLVRNGVPKHGLMECLVLLWDPRYKQNLCLSHIPCTKEQPDYVLLLS
jgi:hypothetical protein